MLDTFDKVTIAAHLIKYPLPKAVGYLSNMFGKEPCRFVLDNLWILDFDPIDYLNEHSFISTKPLYHGGNDTGIFYTDDLCIAKEYRTSGSWFQWLFGIGPAAVHKLPAGTRCAIGRFYSNLGPISGEPGHEYIVLPEWI